MNLSIFSDYHSMSWDAAEKIIELVKSRPEAVICLASGDTPRLTYQLVAKNSVAGNIDFSRISFIGLDEWVGVAPENEGSCRHFFQSMLFDQLNFTPSNLYLFNALSENLEEECRYMDKVIVNKSGIDLMLVGVGMNGHIGFNEPVVSFDSYSHVVELDKMTTSVGQKYFKESTLLKQGITLGLKHFLEAKKVLMLANGLKKAPVIKKMLEEEISTQMPASIIRTHSNSEVILDKEAASMLKSQSIFEV